MYRPDDVGDRLAVNLGADRHLGALRRGPRFALGLRVCEDPEAGALALESAELIAQVAAADRLRLGARLDREAAGHRATARDGPSGHRLGRQVELLTVADASHANRRVNPESVLHLLPP